MLLNYVTVRVITQSLCRRDPFLSEIQAEYDSHVSANDYPAATIANLPELDCIDWEIKGDVNIVDSK